MMVFLISERRTIIDKRAAYLCLHYDGMESTATKLCFAMAHMNRTSVLKT